MKPSDKYNDLDTEEFDDLLEDASGLADSYKATNNIAEALDESAAAIYITGNSHASPAVEAADPDSQHSSDSESELSDSGWLVDDGPELTNRDYAPDCSGHDDNDSPDDDEQTEEEYQPADSQGDSDSTKQWGKLQHNATRVAQRQSRPRAPVTPEQPAHVKQESPPEASNRAAAQNHVRRVQRATAQTARQTPVTPEQPVWVKQEDQPESSRRAAAREHARPELESVPGMKRLKKRMSTDGGRHQYDCSSPSGITFCPPGLCVPCLLCIARLQQVMCMMKTLLKCITPFCWDFQMHNTILLGLDLTVTLQKLHHVVYPLFALSVVSVHQFLSLIQAVLNCSTAQLHSTAAERSMLQIMPFFCVLSLSCNCHWQLSSCNSDYHAVVILQSTLCKGHHASMQMSSCKCHHANVIMQMSSCNCHHAIVIMQLPSCNCHHC